MKVVILCGGLGTRLREETEFRPKPMIQIGPRPILWHIMKTYSHYGFDDFVLSVGYKGEMIKKFFYHYELLNNDISLELGSPEKLRIHQHHGEKGWKLAIADTGLNTLKGARLKRVEKYIDGDVFMCTYGDGVADINIKDLVDFHRSHGKLATLTGVYPLASRFGELQVNGSEVESFQEKPKRSGGLINGGYFVFNRAIFDYLGDTEDSDLEIGPLDVLSREGQLMVFKHPGQWACMDTVRDLEYLNKIWAENQAFWKVWDK